MAKNLSDRVAALEAVVDTSTRRRQLREVLADHIEDYLNEGTEQVVRTWLEHGHQGPLGGKSSTIKGFWEDAEGRIHSFIVSVYSDSRTDDALYEKVERHRAERARQTELRLALEDL